MEDITAASQRALHRMAHARRAYERAERRRVAADGCSRRAAAAQRAAATLRERGVQVEGPIYHSWMPARSIYFQDPDGNDLELCAPVTKS